MNAYRHSIWTRREVLRRLSAAAEPPLGTTSIRLLHDPEMPILCYARALGCDPSAWAFLTGSPAAIRDVARTSGVFHDRRSGGEVDHNLLPSLVDGEGTLRVQYMGERFDPRELLHDLRYLMAEGSSP